ncbi:MAG TPA: DUF3943 domain-containing protein [Paludibacteraceae bacterium]|nr:DUF3943 domain-containing protein [Paludibacteraceae bacterium]HPT43919.1 DUF3943 domain-containing protein [Paludibacteraceae bacterium]
MNNLDYETLNVEDTTSRDSVQKIVGRQPWRVIALDNLCNFSVSGFDLFILNADFAKVNLITIRKNLNQLPVWDTDEFSTNFFWHPYHGSVLHNSARMYGYNFYETIPFNFLGSLSWEYFHENEPPSANDLITTTIGGSSLGEMTFRISDMILDNRSIGFERVGREVIAGLLSPSRFLTRLVSGKAWTFSRKKGNLLPTEPVDFEFDTGIIYLREKSGRNDVGVLARGQLEYGDILKNTIRKPYEWMLLRGQFELLSGKIRASQICGIGALRVHNLLSVRNTSLSAGLFQHFDYYNLKLNMNDGSVLTPFYISEAAAIGPGLIWYRKYLNTEMKVRLYANGIGLGASMSDYFNFDDKDYNTGSGFGFKFFYEFIPSRKLIFSLNAENYQIYTWKGAAKSLYSMKLTKAEIMQLNIQGDQSKTSLNLIGLKINYQLSPRTSISLQGRQYHRHTHYVFFDEMDFSCTEHNISINYSF